MSKKYYLIDIKTAPVWSPLPSKSNLMVVGAVIAVTTPLNVAKVNAKQISK